MSLDGFIDDGGEQRLILSGDEDLDRVDGLRADVDAILVGAGTIRRDDPRLEVRSPERRIARELAGRPSTPIKVTLTRSGRLDPQARFFTAGPADRIVYAVGAAADRCRPLANQAEIVDLGPHGVLRDVCRDLSGRGVERLLVEGGSAIATAVLTEGLVDELQLAVAPFFVGDALAQRFVAEGEFPWTAQRRAQLADVQTAGDVVVLRYALTDLAASSSEQGRA